MPTPFHRIQLRRSSETDFGQSFSKGSPGDLSSRARGILIVTPQGSSISIVSEQTVRDGSDDGCIPLRWYFEEYPVQDTFATSRAGHVRDNLRELGRRLIVEVLSSIECIARLEKSHVLLEIHDASDETEGGSQWFGQLPWEILEDTTLWPTVDQNVSFEPGSIHVVRVHGSPKAVRERTASNKMPASRKSHSGRNILAVTARPFTTDIPHRLITRSIAVATEHAAHAVPGSSQLKVVRPGTFETLMSTLKDHPPGFFDALHLDVHGEADDQGSQLIFIKLNSSRSNPKPDKIDAARLARTVAGYGIDTVVVNACRSAAGTGSASNMARALIEAGVEVAIGMSYNVLSHTADLFMESFYNSFLQHSSAFAAMTEARQTLINSPSRLTNFGTQLHLEDHVVPIFHCNSELLEEFGDFDLENKVQSPLVASLLPKTPVLLGREETILRLEYWLAPPKPLNVLMKGMPGIGKTALLKHLVHWWSRTGLTDHIIYISLADAQFSKLTFDTFLHGLCKSSGLALDLVDTSKLAVELNSKSALVIVDSMESVRWSATKDNQTSKVQIRRFLSKLRQCPILCASRSEVPWLQGLVQATFELQPLTKLDAVDFGRQLIAYSPGINEPDDLMFDQLVAMASGNPLGIKLMMTDLSAYLKKEPVASVQDYLEALIDYKPLYIEQKPSMDDEGDRCVKEVIKLIEKLKLPNKPESMWPWNLTRLLRDIFQVSQQQLKPANKGCWKTRDGLGLRICLSLMGFWRRLPINYEYYFCVLVCLDVARETLSFDKLEKFQGVVLELVDIQSDSLFLRRLERWMSDNPQDIHLCYCIKICLEIADSACRWIDALLKSDLAAFITPDATNSKYLHVNPVLTLVARSFLDRIEFCPSGFTDSVDLALTAFYFELCAEQSYAKRTDHFISDATAQFRLMDENFVTYLPVASSFRRTNFSNTPSRFIICKLVLVSAGNDLLKNLLAERIIHSLIEIAVVEIRRIRSTFWMSDLNCYNEDSQNEQQNQNEWQLCCTLEDCLITILPVAITRCNHVARSDEYYHQTWGILVDRPMRPLYRKVRLKSREMWMAELQHTTAMMKINKDTSSVSTQELEALRQAHATKLAAAGVKLIQPPPTLSTAQSMQDYIYDAERSGIFVPDPVSRRFHELAHPFEQWGPAETIPTEQVRKNLADLQDLLMAETEGLNRLWWRRKIHGRMADLNDSLGDYIRAYEQKELKEMVEKRMNPEVVKRTRQWEAQWEDYRLKYHTANSAPRSYTSYRQKVEEALVIERLGLEKAQKDQPPDALDILARQRHIAFLLADIFRHDEAIPILQTVISGRRAIFRVEDEGVLDPTYDLVKVYSRAMRPDEGIPLAQTLLANAAEGESSSQNKRLFILNTRILLAEMLYVKAFRNRQHRGEQWLHDLLQEAQSHFEAARAVREDLYGAHDVSVVWMLIWLARVGIEQTRYEHAISLTEQAIAIRRAVLPEPVANRDAELMTAQHILAQARFWNGQVEGAEALLVDLIPRLLERLSADHPDTLGAVAKLGFLYESKGEVGEARALAKRWFVGLRKMGLLKEGEGGFSFGLKGLGDLEG